jgi:3-phosphoshikimate 1-carboxyvinyltransferase
MTGAVLITPPGRPLRGQATLPGSKSITNRALLLAALGSGESRITGALKSEDTARMAEALEALGVSVHEPDATRFTVKSPGRLQPPLRTLELGNAGTAMRFLTAACALVDGAATLDGEPAMRRRPIAALIEALRRLGVDAEAPTGCPPVTVRGRGGFDGGRVEVDAGLSSQFVSALLMLAACGRGEVEVALAGPQIGARGYVDLTVAAMRRFGARVQAVDSSAWRVAPTGYRATDFAVEPDASAATYLWAAERLTGGAIDLGLPPDRFTQPDARAHALIQAWPDMPGEIDGAQMQDAIPTLAVMAAFNRTPVRFTGVANLRVKECDRVAALATELSRIAPGLAREDRDDLVVAGEPGLAERAPRVEIETYRDHRMAMSLALAGLKLDGIRILDPGCVAKTFPGYWDTLAGLGVDLHGA